MTMLKLQIIRLKPLIRTHKLNWPPRKFKDKRCVEFYFNIFYINIFLGRGSQAWESMYQWKRKHVVNDRDTWPEGRTEEVSYVDTALKDCDCAWHPSPRQYLKK